VRALLGRGLRRYLIAGLLIWLPLGVTFLTFKFLLDLFDQILLLLPKHLQPDTLFGFHIPGLGAILSLLVLLATGVLVTNLIGRTLVRWWEDLLNRIPLVRSIYSGVKGFTDTLVSKGGGSLRKVVLIEYPRKEMWSIGFVTATDLPEISAATGDTQVCVYVPTTPNPTSGFIVMLPQSQVIECEMSADAAMKMIVTLGVVVPPPSARFLATRQ
jgi:uncharacterized membrane protein